MDLDALTDEELLALNHKAAKSYWQAKADRLLPRDRRTLTTAQRLAAITHYESIQPTVRQRLSKGIKRTYVNSD